jgi:DNA (cytosine-5)-methyltransferase 1
VTVGSLFAGIGGFDLGFERAGFEIKWQVEIDPFARRVLEKHWPNVQRYEDVRTLNSPEPVDVVCGGFPCQPHSLAGRRGGSADERDLWPEFARIIRAARPRWVVAENVPGLLSSDAGRFFGTVLGDLAACGYDAEWDCLSASAFGAPHIRERVWIVAHANGSRPQERFVFTSLPPGTGRDDDGKDAAVGGWWTTEPRVGRVAHGIPAELDFVRGVIGEEGDYSQAEPAARELVRQILRTMWEHRALAASSPDLYRERLRDLVPGLSQERARQGWLLGSRLEGDEELCRLLQAVPTEPFQEAQDVLSGVLERIGTKKRPQALGSRVDRLRGLGNAIVPQIAQWIAERIKEAEGVAA